MDSYAPASVQNLHGAGLQLRRLRVASYALVMVGLVGPQEVHDLSLTVEANLAHVQDTFQSLWATAVDHYNRPGTENRVCQELPEAQCFIRTKIGV